MYCSTRLEVWHFTVCFDVACLGPFQLSMPPPFTIWVNHEKKDYVDVVQLFFWWMKQKLIFHPSLIRCHAWCLPDEVGNSNICTHIICHKSHLTWWRHPTHIVHVQLLSCAIQLTGPSLRPLSYTPTKFWQFSEVNLRQLVAVVKGGQIQ